MAYIKINNLNVYYEKAGKSGKKVVLLHGWGQNTEMMSFISDSLKKHFVVYNIDFPGFGKSDMPESAWGCEDYCEFLHGFCIKNNIDNPIFIAHSFGCRIAVRYAHKYGVYKMVLTGAAGVREKRTIGWYIKTYSYKIAKTMLPKSIIKRIQNNIGSEDYNNTSGVMRQTFVKVVNDDITPLLKDIETETLLVFGENDTATPIAKGKKMEKLMKDATLIIFENDDHYAYINEAIRFNAVLDAFLRSDY